LGNVLQLPKGQFDLIDLSYMKVENRPLAASKCRRNLQPMLRYEEDRQWLAEEHRGKLRTELLVLGIERLHRA
jgi:hypothetical protein